MSARCRSTCGASALTAYSVILLAVVMGFVELARGRDPGPWGVICAVAGLTYLVSIVVLSRRADAPGRVIRPPGRPGSGRSSGWRTTPSSLRVSAGLPLWRRRLWRHQVSMITGVCLVERARVACRELFVVLLGQPQQGLGDRQRGQVHLPGPGPIGGQVGGPLSGLTGSGGCQASLRTASGWSRFSVGRECSSARAATTARTAARRLAATGSRSDQRCAGAARPSPARTGRQRDVRLSAGAPDCADPFRRVAFGAPAPEPRESGERLGGARR